MNGLAWEARVAVIELDQSDPPSTPGAANP